MRSLPLPGWALAEVYEQCISNLVPLDRRRRFAGAIDRIREIEHDYERLAEEGYAHLIAAPKIITSEAGDLAGDEVAQLYDSKLVAKSAFTRSVYDKLRLSVPGNICPYCGQSPIRTLDHYLPRSQAKFLAVSPLNLVPCCRDCNSEKKEFIADIDQGSIIHPYFDRNFQQIEWLQAEIIENDPVALRFFIKPTDDGIGNRLTLHFKVFNLAFYYATHSAVELVNLRSFLVRLYDLGGIDAVREELQGRLDSASTVYKNSWQTAFFRALHQSDDFCSGGFMNIPAPS